MKTLDSFLLQKCVNLSLLIQHYKTIAEKMFNKTFCCLFPFDLLHFYNAVKFRVQVGQQPFQRWSTEPPTLVCDSNEPPLNTVVYFKGISHNLTMWLKPQ